MFENKTDNLEQGDNSKKDLDVSQLNLEKIISVIFDNLSPIILFYKFIDESLINKIYTNTKIYIKKHKKYFSIEISKKYTWLFIYNIYFSIFQLPEKEMSWNSKFIKTIIRYIMSKSSFFEINKYIHISK